MNREEKIRRAKELDRFTQTPEGTEIVFYPQCNNCIHNQGATECAKFGTKPEGYRTNKKGCPVKEEE